jgi:hypothetical protein
MNKVLSRVSPAVFGLCTALAMAVPANASNITHDMTVDGIRVFYGLVPVSWFNSFPPGSEETYKHASRPKRAGNYHLVVAVFEAGTMTRIADARVVAKVSEIGMGEVVRKLEPTELGGATTYCGYFLLPEHVEYSLKIDVTRSDMPRTITADFTWKGF